MGRLDRYHTLTEYRYEVTAAAVTFHRSSNSSNTIILLSFLAAQHHERMSTLKTLNWLSSPLAVAPPSGYSFFQKSTVLDKNIRRYESTVALNVQCSWGGGIERDRAIVNAWHSNAYA
ncbi:hypothetical protein EVAR_18960_1 [Eumeta japonica]|uniref:Uncharacterized protein n=1 Tax=Eumeta variegata TaxID=151549 RepID=A0A4C1X007_EUMVA|nr:hypothetical protein EVAR_18960_1 [Eumeta japonica]